MRNSLGIERLPPDQLDRLPRDVARFYFSFRAGDIRARLWLLDRAEEQYDAGEMLGAAILFHAEMYLKDRRAYEIDPPPDQFAIPIPPGEPSNE